MPTSNVKGNVKNDISKEIRKNKIDRAFFKGESVGAGDG
jgi:hypothetical protein